jgi:hypothetical protein
MVVETVRADGVGTWVVGLVGQRTRQFRRVTLTRGNMQAIQVLDSALRFDGDGQLLRLGLEAYRLAIAYEFDPYFGLSISRVDRSRINWRQFTITCSNWGGCASSWPTMPGPGKP